MPGVYNGVPYQPQYQAPSGMQASVPPSVGAAVPYTQPPYNQAVQQGPAVATGYYQYQQPPPTGNRKALLIGVNYFGQRGQLKGSITEYRSWIYLLSLVL
jgi:hypothetical protein